MYYSSPITWIHLLNCFPPLWRTVGFWNTIYALHDFFYRLHSCIHLFLFSIHMWPTHLFDSKGARLVGFFLWRVCVVAMAASFWKGKSPAEALNLKLFVSFSLGFACVLQHVPVYIKGAGLIKKPLISPYRLLQCPNCWRLHFFLYDKAQ